MAESRTPTNPIKPNSIHMDAGGRTRVSQLTTLGDLKCLNTDNTLLLENVGTGTGSYTPNKYNMSVGAGQYLIRRSRHYYPYFSGKSQFIELTFDKFNSQAGVTKRVGYFSSNAVAPYDSTKDGFWIEDNGTTKSLIVQRSGVEVLNLPITSWDNYSAIASYDWSMFTVIAFDYLWLGGAVLRLFVKTGEGFTLVHTYNYSGTSQDTFITSPNQTVRYEIRSTGGAGEFSLFISKWYSA